VDFLVSQWTLGYKKLAALNINDFSPKSMYRAYIKMLQVSILPFYFINHFKN
jgi:hypothetical protein